MMHRRDSESDSHSVHSKDSGYSHSDDSSCGKSSDSTAVEYFATRPPLAHYETCGGRIEYSSNHTRVDYESLERLIEDPRLSVETYASTVPSEHGFDDDNDDDNNNDKDIAWDHHYVEERRPEVFYSNVLVPTPADFAGLFPSDNVLNIRHDDSSSDGNMNLRVTTRVSVSPYREQDVSLFHLRMYDLKKREFSLRRYCRDSGREVCHSVRKYQKPVTERPGLQRPLSNMLAAFRSKSETKSATAGTLKRSDSGYESILPPKDLDVERRPSTGSTSVSAASSVKRHNPIPTNTTKLEFSSYAQVDVKRRGTKNSKRYEFEYWGNSYTWKKFVNKRFSPEAVSYHLFRNSEDHAVARIEPVPMPKAQAKEERNKGGWVPPCNMRIDDSTIEENKNEVADVVVASGLIALVDDCIKRYFHPNQARHQLVIPIPKLKVDLEYVGAKRILSDAFNRPSRESSTSRHRPTPHRNMTHDV